jgi:indole-3-glycerol phosphate synthase
VTILDRILERKVQEVRTLRRERGEAELLRAAASAPAPRDFAAALRSGAAPRVIAEFKRASPSAGPIREGAEPAAIARAYESAGAAALSVLTDAEFFRGSLEDLRAARAAVSLPVLRKDFTLDPLQVLEGRAAGADAVLLIVAALDDATLRALLAVAADQSLAALVEVHTREELERALEAGAALVGVNNRDLRTFKTDVEVTRSLLPHADGRTLVSESGLSDAETVGRLAAEGVDAFLVGEALMRAPDPAEALRRLRGGAPCE